MKNPLIDSMSRCKPLMDTLKYWASAEYAESIMAESKKYYGNPIVYVRSEPIKRIK